MKARLKSRAISLHTAIACLMFAGPGALAQTPPTQLNIIVVKGEGAVNDIGHRVGTEPVVRVEDENHRPVAGAVVIFTLPTEGATGEFGRHDKSLIVVTDSQGEAIARGLRTNDVEGKLPIHINASYRGLATQNNMTLFSVAQNSGKRMSGKMAAIILIIGGAAAGGAVAALHNNKQSPAAGAPPAPTPIGITPGSGTVGAPH